MQRPEPTLSYRVPDSSIREFGRAGVCRLRAVFDPAWLDYLRAAVEKAMSHPGVHAEEHVGSDESGRFFEDVYLWRRHAEFLHFALSSPAASIAARFMKSTSAALLYDQVFVKEPGTLKRTPWHQDKPYWAVSGSQMCSLWVALDTVSPESSVEFVRGSQTWGDYRPSHFVDGSPYVGRALPALPDISKHRASYDIVRWQLNPGDCLVFHPLIVHGAPGNRRLDARRRAVVTRWIGDDVRFQPVEGEVAFPKDAGPLRSGDRLPARIAPRAWPRHDSH